MWILLIIVCAFLFYQLKKNKKHKKSASSTQKFYISEDNSLRVKTNAEEVISCEERIKTAIPDEYGLYPHEILLLHYASTYIVGTKNFQGFWYYKYGIKSVDNILNTLVQRNFLEENIDILLNLEQSNITQLKELLNEYNLPSSGKKDILINTIMKSIPEEKIDEKFKVQRYILTEKGSSALRKSEYVVYIHNHPNIDDLDIWNLNKLINSEPKMEFHDKIWAYLNKKSMEYTNNKNFGLYRNTRLSMYQQCFEEKQYKSAYQMLMEVIYYDINNYLGNNFNKVSLKITLEESFFKSNLIKKIPTGIFTSMNKLQEKLNISDEQLKIDLLSYWDKLILPYNVFSTEECVKIYFLERDNKINTLKEIYSKKRKDILKW